MLSQQDELLAIGPDVHLVLKDNITVFYSDQYEIELNISLAEEDIEKKLIKSELPVSKFLGIIKKSGHSLEESERVLEVLLDKDILQYKNKFGKILNMHKLTSFDLIQPGVVEFAQEDDINSEVVDLKKSIKLIKPSIGKTTLLEAINTRSSSRKFKDAPLTLQQLSTLLWSMYGFRDEGGRTVASAGGAYPLRIFIYNKNILNLEKGLYEYIPKGHRLICIDKKDIQLEDILLTHNINYNQSGALVFICGTLDVICRRYSERGYRYLLIEAGLVSQNLSLVSSGTEIDSVIVGGFDDTSLSSYLELPDNSINLLSVVIGNGAKIR